MYHKTVIVSAAPHPLAVAVQEQQPVVAVVKLPLDDRCRLRRRARFNDSIVGVVLPAWILIMLGLLLLVMLKCAKLACTLVSRLGTLQIVGRKGYGVKINIPVLNLCYYLKQPGFSVGCSYKSKSATI